MRACVASHLHTEGQSLLVQSMDASLFEQDRATGLASTQHCSMAVDMHLVVLCSVGWHIRACGAEVAGASIHPSCRLDWQGYWSMPGGSESPVGPCGVSIGCRWLP